MVVWVAETLETIQNSSTNTERLGGQRRGKSGKQLRHPSSRLHFNQTPGVLGGRKDPLLHQAALHDCASGLGRCVALSRVFNLSGPWLLLSQTGRLRTTTGFLGFRCNHQLTQSFHYSAGTQKTRVLKIIHRQGSPWQNKRGKHWA